MAHAIKFQDMIDRGEVRDYADLARLGYVSRARITQIMSLLNLSPKIQETLLFSDGASNYRSTMCEHSIRSVARSVFGKARLPLSKLSRPLDSALII
jgi:hypothetical protein